ncbi:MAG: hypothetical protein IRY95_07340, partial [Clostridia bacterium]|nr:hypothetical protein [Clostridia bacterium]
MAKPLPLLPIAVAALAGAGLAASLAVTPSGDGPAGRLGPSLVAMVATLAFLLSWAFLPYRARAGTLLLAGAVTALAFAAYDLRRQGAGAALTPWEGRRVRLCGRAEPAERTVGRAGGGDVRRWTLSVSVLQPDTRREEALAATPLPVGGRLAVAQEGGRAPAPGTPVCAAGLLRRALGPANP